MAELAVLFPLLMLLIIGSLDIARAYNAYVGISTAAREGARYAAQHPTDQAGITNRVNQELDQSGITGVTVGAPACFNSNGSTSKPCDPAASGGVISGDRIRITVSMPFNLLSFYVLGLPSITLSNFAPMAVAIL